MEHPVSRTGVWFVAPILLIAVALRLIGLDYGLPFPLIPGEMAGVVGVPPDNGVLVAGRLLSLLLSTATVWLAWRLALDLFDSPVAGLVAAALLATSWYAALLGHTALGWSATGFALWLVIWRAHRWLGRPTAAGLIPLVLALVVALVIVVFWLMPSVSFDRGMAAGGPMTVGDYVGAVLRADPVLAVAGVVGVLSFVLTRPVTAALLAAAFAIGLIVAAWCLGDEAALVPLLPLLALGAGGGAARLARWLGRRRALSRLVVGLAAIALLYPLATAGWMAWLMAQDDTRLQARAWLQEHLPPDLPLVVDMAPVTVETNNRGLEDQAALAPGGLSHAPPADHGGVAYRTVHINDLPSDMVSGDAGFLLFDELVSHGFFTYVIAVRPDRQATNFQIAALESTVRLDEFVPSFDYRAPLAPDFASGRLATAPVWSFFLLERLGPPTSVAFAAYAASQ
ncbi:MAG: hypothetical protein AAF563_13855 [Pseudomonadota bacterium]